MIALDTALLGILISLIITIIVGSVWVGKMSERIRNNRYDIEAYNKDLKDYQKENKEEHKSIIFKLDKILMNGKGS